jgi:hypothetical protein
MDSKRQYSNLRIIDWDLVTRTDPKVLLETRDRDVLEHATKMFMKSGALFSDPSFSPPDLVLKLFLLMKVVITDLISERDELRELADRYHRELKTVPSCRTHPYVSLRILFQCPYGPNVFIGRHFVWGHICGATRSAGDTQTRPAPVRPAPHQVYVVNRPISEEEKGAYDAELAAMLDHCETLMHNQELELRTELNNKIRKLEEDQEVWRMELQANLPPPANGGGGKSGSP